MELFKRNGKFVAWIENGKVRTDSYFNTPTIDCGDDDDNICYCSDCYWDTWLEKKSLVDGKMIASTECKQDVAKAQKLYDERKSNGN